MARKVSQHRIFDLTVTLIVVAVVCTLRSTIFPSGDEAIPNVSTPIGHLLQTVQLRIPVFAALIWALAIIVAGLNAGRYGVRLSLYPAYTLMGISLFGVVATAVMVSGDYLLSAVAMAVMLLATKYMQRFIMRSGSYSDLSLSMLYFGLLPLVYAPAALFYVALPIIVLFVRASWRDELVTLASLLFPPAAICYWSWCAGSGFSTPITECYFALILPSGFTALSLIGGASFGVLAIVAVMVVCSATIYLSDKYSLNGRARVAMRFIIVMIALATVMLLMPSSSATALSLLAIPVSSLVPLMFIRMKHSITQLLWRALLLMVALNIIVLIFM